MFRCRTFTEVRDMERYGREDTDAFDERNSRVALYSRGCVNIERGLRALLLRLEKLGFCHETVVDSRLNSFLDCLRGFQCALTHENLLPSGPELIKALGRLENDFLMSPIE